MRNKLICRAKFIKLCSLSVRVYLPDIRQPLTAAPNTTRRRATRRRQKRKQIKIKRKQMKMKNWIRMCALLCAHIFGLRVVSPPIHIENVRRCQRTFAQDVSCLFTSFVVIFRNCKQSTHLSFSLSVSSSPSSFFALKIENSKLNRKYQIRSKCERNLWKFETTDVVVLYNFINILRHRHSLSPLRILPRLWSCSLVEYCQRTIQCVNSLICLCRCKFTLSQNSFEFDVYELCCSRTMWDVTNYYLRWNYDNCMSTLWHM